MVSGSCENWCPVMQGLAPRGSPLCLSSHAEANGLLRSDWTGIQKGTIYSSAATCIGCARLIAGAGLAALVHCVSGEDDERRNPDAVEKYLSEAGVAVRRYRG
jgi:deoxycytidylate deaminase